MNRMTSKRCILQEISSRLAMEASTDVDTGINNDAVPAISLEK